MDQIEKYFQGEKWQCTVGIVFSMLCIFLSVYFLFLQKPMLKGIAYSTIPIALLLCTICIGVVVRVPRDIERVSRYYKVDAAKLQMEELPRMEKVMKTFTLLKTIEIALCLASILLAFLLWKNELYRGVFIGIMILTALLYLFDYAASQRGKVYVEFLKSI